eukprot:g10608.t1
MADDGGPMRMLDLEPGMLYGTATSVLRLRDFEHMYHSCCYRQSNFMDRFIEPFAVSLFQYSSLLRIPIFSVLILAVNAAYLALLVKRLKSSSTAGSAPDKDNSNFYPDHYAQALSLGLAGYFLAKQSERQIADHHRVVSSVPQPPTPGPGESRESDEFGSKWYEWENDVFVPWYEKWHDKLKTRHPWITSRTQLTGTREEDSRQQVMVGFGTTCCDLILTDSGFSDVDWSDDNETWRLVIQSLCVVNLVGCAILAFFTWRRGKKQNAAMKAKALLSEKTLSRPSVDKVDDEKITGEKVEASKVQRSQECFAGETQKTAALTTKKASPPSTAAETSRQNSKSLDNYDVLEALEGIDADEAVVPVDEQTVSRSPSLDVVSEAEAVIAEGEHMAAITEKQPPPPTKTAFSTASKGSLVVALPMKDSRRQFGAQVLGAVSTALTVFLLDGFPFIRKPKAKSAPRLTSQFSRFSARLQKFTVYRAVTAILSNTFSVGFGLAAMFLMYKHIQSKMGNRKFLNNREWVIVFLLAPLGQTVVFFAACRVFKLLSASIPQVGANTRFQLRKNPVTLFLAFVTDHVWRGGARVFRGMLLGLTVYFGGYFVGFSAVGFGFFAAVAVGMLFLMFVALSVANRACQLGQSAIADFEKNAERLGAENRDVLENFQEAEELLPELMDWLAELPGVTDFSEWLRRGFTGGVGATVLRLQEHALAEDGVLQRAIGKCEEKLRKKVLGCAVVKEFLTDAARVSKEARDVYETEVLPEIQRLLTQARRFSEKQRTKLDTAFLARWRVLRGGLEFVVAKLGAVRDKLKAAIGAAEKLGSWDSKNVAGKNSALRLCCGRLVGKVVGRGEEIVAELKGKASVHGLLQRMEEKIAERRQEVVADAHAAVEEAAEMVRDKVEEEVLGTLQKVSAGLLSVRGWLAKAQVFVAEVEKLEEAVEAAKEPSDMDNAGANDKSESRVAAPFRGALERGIEKADEMEALVHEARLLLETLQRQKESLLQEARNTIPPAEGGTLVPTKFSQQHTAAALHIDARIAKKTQELELLFCGELAAAMETAGFGRLEDAQVAEDVTAEDDVTSMRGRMLQPLCRAVGKLERILAHVIGVETHLGAQVEDMAELENNQLSGLAESFTNLGAQFKDAPAHAATAEHLHAQISVELRAQTLQIVAQTGSALHLLQKQKDNLVGAKEETAALCQEIFGEVELTILFPDSLAALGNALGAAIQDEVSAFASVLSSFTSLRPPALAFSCRSPALLFRQCLRFLVFYVPSILALTVVDLFKFCADALLLVASIVSIQTTLELSDLDLDLVIFHDFSVSAKFAQLFSALQQSVVPVIGFLVQELFSHFDFLFTEVNLSVGDVMGTRSNCTLAIVLFAAGILTGSTFLLCQVIGGDWLGLLVGGRAKLLITERNLRFAACRAKSAGDMDQNDDVFAPGACSWVSVKACAAGGILKALPAVFKGISAGIFLALQVTLIMANQYTCYLFVLLIQGYEVDPTDPVSQPGTACDELGNAFPELDGNLQNEDTAMVTGLSTTEMLLSATLSVAFMLLAVLSLASGFVLLQGPLCWLSQKLVDAIYREGARETRGWRAYFVGRSASVSPSAGGSGTEPGDLSAEGAEKGSTPTTTIRTASMLTPRPATIASTLRTGLDPVSGLRNRRGQVAAGPLAVAGVWDETVRNCFCLNERCRAYALSMGFCGREQKAAWKQYLQEMQEATGKALSGLFLLFPFGALITKTVEYLNTPDLDWGHRRQVVAKPVGVEEKTVEEEEADFVIEEKDEEDDELTEGSGEDFSAGGFLLRHTWFTPRDWRARRWMGLGQVGKLALLQMVVFYGGDVTGLVTLFTCLSLVMQTVLDSWRNFMKG